MDSIFYISYNYRNWENNIRAEEETAAATNMDSELRKDLLPELTLRFMSASVRRKNKSPKSTVAIKKTTKTSSQDRQLAVLATAQQQFSEEERC